MTNFTSQSNNITFVTAYFNIYETPFQNKDIEWRFRHFQKLAETGIQISLFCSPDCKNHVDQMLQKFHNIRVLQYMNLYDTWTANTLKEVETEIGEPIGLPDSRNVEKDSREYILLMNSKTEFLKMAVEKNVWNSSHFAWIDFNIFHIFQGESQTNYVSTFLKNLSKRRLATRFLTLPGCWGKQNVYEPYLVNDVCWRFCGGFFIGSAGRMLEFHDYYIKYFADFLREKRKLVWEVNMWAYYELKYDMSVIWYPGDHNKTILEINAANMCFRLSDFPNCKHIVYDYPNMFPYIPTSSSYLFFKGKHYMNVRYVNYWIYPNGGYLIHDENNCLRTRNFFIELNPTDLLPCVSDQSVQGFKEIYDSPFVSGLTCHGGNIYGLEDIRLYEHFGELRFVGTSVNYSGSGKSRIVIGNYDIQYGYVRNCRVLTPPTGNDWYEKNWIPIAYTIPTEEYFIYKWMPFEIGVLVENKLEIIMSWDNHIFSNVRGSTVFIECEEGLLGVVHFSYEGHPRHYFHMLVLLDKATKFPLKYSEYFYFNNISIEFCIGFSIIEDKYHFWISNFDRDPELMIVDRCEIPLLFDCL